MLPPVLILALDGATFDVIEPLVARGRLPNLARWLREGEAAPLRSVVPPVTFPAWSSFMTGLEPGEHGIFDFTQKVPGAYRLRFVNASDRSGASLFRRIGEVGGRVLVLGLPATYPPEPLPGLLVCGFDAPVSTGTDARSASDPDLYEQIASRAGPWMRPDLDESAQGDFHDRAWPVLVDRVERKTRFAREALETLRRRGEAPDLMMVVFSESDTVGHHYWRDHDPGSARHDPAAPAERRGAIAAVYEALDRACGVLRESFGPEAACLVMSDHGMGPAARRVLHLNRWLEERGFLARSGGGAGDWKPRLARAARSAALRLLPPRAAQAVFRRARGAAARVESAARFGGLDWSRTRAFSEEANTLPGIWINLAEREPRGCVAPGDYETLRDELAAALYEWRLPKDPRDPGTGGLSAVARVHRREDLWTGPHVERAPDLVLELATPQGQGLSLVPTPWQEPGGPPAVRTLGEDELAGGRGRGMNGTHRPDGILIACGGAAGRPHFVAQPRLTDVAPAVLTYMGVHAERGPDEGSPARIEYAPEEDELVARRLRALGYLE